MARTIRVSVTQENDLLASTLANVNRNVDYWLAHPEACVHLKASDGSGLIGVVLVKEHWNLCSLFVEPEHHGRGVGRALVEAAAVQCRGRSPRQALLLNAAVGAIPFYTRLGFEARATSQLLPPGFLAMHRPL
jgi:GNAT superfamily N-acetyltransferase